jgi:predicted dehydrogenase/threonine dehydrogenase-like Zn-dependent dehydrogenase
MRQILQNIANGETQLVEIPCPQVKVGQLLITTATTLISVGTERMLIDFGKASWVSKARSQPDKVKMVLGKIKTDGLIATVDTIRSKLDQPLSLGYCNVGVVQDNGETDFSVGTRVVSNGNHAEVVRVAKNLCAKVPENVDDESAAFTVLAAISLQGIRIANPTIGEVVVVTGLGLVGLITIQILRANGCRVIGIDFDSSKCELARRFGAETVDLSRDEDPISKANSFSRGRGVDAVIITASTKSNQPVSQAAAMCRKRGRVVLVGVVGLELSRADFYEKEISFQVSCSYGPGRYDNEYEEKGIDYPVGYVRWTEQRNFEAVLDLMASGVINMKPLISHRYEIDDAFKAYQTLDDHSTLGVLLNYSENAEKLLAKKIINISKPVSYLAKDVVCGFIGGGNYASRILIPAFKLSGAKLDTLLTSIGVNAVHHGKKNGFISASTDISQLLKNDDINTIVIATQHNLHAEQVISAIKAGKNVFVEKPLALNHTELDAIEAAYEMQTAETKCRLMVGYNRRFAPHVIKLKSLLTNISEPKSFIMTMNSGSIPSEHWTQDISIGGGRIIGEACHYIDLMRFLAGSKITGFTATCIGAVAGIDVREDKASITITFADGSFGTILYLANGGKAFAKERIEVFANDGVLQLDNFRKLEGYDWPGFNKYKLRSQDKGQNACAKAFVESIERGLDSPISFDEIMEVARVSVDIAESLRK